MVIVVLIAAPQARKAALEKAETLNARTVAEALRDDLGKAVVPDSGASTKPSTNAARQKGWQSWRIPETLSTTHDDAKQTRCRGTPS